MQKGFALSALLYVMVVTHPLFNYLDHLTQSGSLHGSLLPDGKHFADQAYTDDSFFMPQNTKHDVTRLMVALEKVDLATSLKVNLHKSKLLSNLEEE